MQIDGTLREFGHITVFDIPQPLLGEQRRRKIRLTIKGRVYRTHACRLRSGEAVIIIPRHLIQELNLRNGQNILVDLDIRHDRGREHIPSELRLALDAAGCDLSILPVFERRQLINLVREASNPEVRRKRIEAVLKVCHERNRRT